METRFYQPRDHAYEVMEITYTDDIDVMQNQIESDVLPVMFHNEKPECSDDIITQIKKLKDHFQPPDV